MKKTIFLTTLSFCSILFSYAQPILTNLSSYSLIVHSVGNDESVPAGNPGANLNWNFSSFVAGSLTGNATTITVESAPGHEQFPLANFCQKFTSSSFTPPLEKYTFYKITVSGREILGETNGQGVVTLQYSDTPNWTLPLQYNDAFVDNSQTTTDATPIASTVTYDAYGTLTTPYGTYQNVIRIKTVNSNYTNYFWVQVLPNYLPLMEIASNASIGVQATIYEPVALSTEKFAKEELLVYPNPSNNYINIRLAKNIAAEKITIKDLTGKNVLEVAQPTNPLNIEKLSSGVYLLEVFSRNSQYQTKFIKG